MRLRGDIRRTRPGPNAPCRAGLGIFAAVLLGSAGAAGACDICAIYTATELQQVRTGLQLGVAEQFTDFGTLQRDGEEVANPAGENLDSSITQFIVGYRLHPRLGLQANVPLISRHYRRFTAAGIESGDSTGVGDVSILTDFLAYSTVGETSLTQISLLAGIKLPTGSTNFLGEEIAPDAVADLRDRIKEADPFPSAGKTSLQPRHDHGPGEPESGIHGHDLTRGSGSTDFVVGGHVLSTWKRLYVSAQLQYFVRTQGAYGYKFADDLVVQGGPGVFLLLGHDHSLTLQAVVSADTKGKDRLHGEKQDDTGYTGVYAGPGFDFTWGTSLSAGIIADLPVVRNNTSLQIVPDYRLRGGILWRF
jgi:hypothetical protein